MADGVRVLVFASQKGGSGKTTLSGHIAVEAERSGDGPVALIDTDPQGSLAKWWNARAASTPAFAHCTLDELDACLDHLRGLGFKLIVVDTPPAVTQTISHVVARADMVVVPTRPSPHDLRAVGPTVDIADALGKPLVFVVNSATPRARITSETAVALSQHGVVAPVTLHHRVDFAASMIDGRTVGDIQPDSRSAKEVTALWLYMRDRLARLYGGKDPAWAEKPRADFSTAVLTPETGAGAPVLAEGEDDDWEPELPAWADNAVANLTADKQRRPATQPTVPKGAPATPSLAPPQMQQPLPQPITAHQPITTPVPANDAQKQMERVNLERRQADRGPPQGQERRIPRTFGRRSAPH
jgi:chromosome partitioning protein